MARRTGSDGTRTRAAIRAAATRLFARLGYEALTMRRLGQEIGVGAAALYRYFPNKQAILFDLLKRHMEELHAAWDAARPDDNAPAPDRLAALTRFHIRHHLACSDSMVLSCMELRSLSPENFRVIEEMRRRYEAEIAAIIADGIGAKTLTPRDPRVTARAIIALMNGLTTWYRPDGAIGPPEIEDICQEMVAGVAGPLEREETQCSMPA